MAEYALGDALKMFIDNSRMKNALLTVQLETVWEELMGKTIAKYTEKIYIVHGTLVIKTNVAPLKQELQFQSNEIKLRINEKLGANTVQKVVIQ
ncbi:MAG TPA: DUF721 domain-containing protein [Chitinophagaceae bacterium]|nr:DUF721 domain-containing protein [Chitinophagaceae bacterium]HAN37548.1 DUF721 domain-containing protein [Chitinophagaceae bacterium]